MPRWDKVVAVVFPEFTEPDTTAAAEFVGFTGFCQTSRTQLERSCFDLGKIGDHSFLLPLHHRPPLGQVVVLSSPCFTKDLAASCGKSFLLRTDFNYAQQCRISLSHSNSAGGNVPPPRPIPPACGIEVAWYLIEAVQIEIHCNQHIDWRIPGYAALPAYGLGRNRIEKRLRKPTRLHAGSDAYPGVS